MISSMQKNKKWLLPTIWISTIAFVGAGFVGWGSYSPGSTTTSVAVVGKKEIPLNDLQQEYSNLYSQYQKTLGQQFNAEIAKQFKLESLALNNLIQKYLILNLADDFGIISSDEEVFKELVKIPSFLKNGVFDNNTYKSILKQNQTSPKEFEEQIRKNLIIQKVQDIYKSSVNDDIVKIFSTLVFAKDKISISILNSKDMSVTVDETKLKEYYNKNKNNYKSIEKYEVNIQKIAIGEDEKKSKTQALKKYLKLKKAKEVFSEKIILDKNVDYLSIEEQNSIFNSELGSVLKPIRVDNDYIIYQLTRKIPAQVLEFKEVKTQVNADYTKYQKNILLNQKKDVLLKDFTGKDIGFLDKTVPIKISGLSQSEVTSLTNKVSSSTNLIDFIQLDNKIVVFKILDTSLSSYDAKNDDAVKNSILQLKSQVTLTSLIEKLKSTYKVKKNYKVN